LNYKNVEVTDGKLLNCILKSKLSAVILIELSSGEKSGYQLMKSMGEKIGWRPSAGAIYPILKALSFNGFINIRNVPSGRRTKYYSLSSKGRKVFEAIKNADFIREFFVKSAANSINLLAYIERDDKMKREALTQVFSKVYGFLKDEKIYPEVIKLHLAILGLISRKDFSKEKRKKFLRLTSRFINNISRMST